jgi:hypothetical protein
MEDLHLWGITDLTEEYANELSHYQGDIFLHDLTALTESAARHLAKKTGSISFNKLKTITDSAAKALSTHQGCLYFDALETISSSAAEALAVRHGWLLSLGGLVEIPTIAAKYLSRFIGELWINNVLVSANFDIEHQGAITERHIVIPEGSHLTPVVTKFLSCCGETLIIPGVESLDDNILKILSGHKAVICLNQLKQITNKGLKYLSKHLGGIHLDNIENLPEEALRHFSSFTFPLSLNGLKTLTEENAKHISSHQGTLYLNGVSQLSDESIYHLSSHIGDLHLDGLTEISAVAAKYLSSFRGRNLHLNGLKTLLPAVSKHIMEFRGNLFLNGLTSISSDEAKYVPNHTGTLSMSGITRFEDVETEKYFGQHCGPLNLKGLQNISEHFGEHFSQNAWELRIGLEKVTTEEAEQLALHKGPLSLNQLTEISDSAIGKLACHTGGRLKLNGIESLSEEGAEFLSGYKGRLHLDGITTITWDLLSLFNPIHDLFGYEHLYDIDGLILLSLNGVKSFDDNIWTIHGFDHTYIQDISLNGISGDLYDFALAPLPYGRRIYLNGVSRIDCHYIELEGKFDYIHLDGLIELQHEVAAKIVHAPNTPRYVSFGSLKSISRELAKIFSSFDHVISLNGLKHISTHVLDGFYSSHRYDYGTSEVNGFEFDALTFLSPKEFQKFSYYYIDHLSFDSINEITPYFIDCMTRMIPHGLRRNYLGLNGVKVLSAEHINAIFHFPRKLVFDGVTKLDILTAHALGESLTFENCTLYLDGIKILDESVADHLLRFKGCLSLDGILTIQTALKAFSSRKGDLSLNGLTYLLDDEAEALSNHVGTLSLDGLSTISDSAAAFLSKHDGAITLKGLTSISKEAAEQLSRHPKIAFGKVPPFIK